MAHEAAVGRMERVQHAVDGARDPMRRERSRMIRENPPEGLSLQEVHHEVPGIARLDLADVPHRYDVRVLERARGATSLMNRSSSPRGELRVEQLDGVTRPQEPVLGEEHAPHAALAQELEQPVLQHA